MIKYLVQIAVVVVAFIFGGCWQNRSPRWKVTVSDAKYVDAVVDQTTIKPGEVTELRADEGNQFLVLRISLENLLNSENSYRMEDVCLRDSAGKKYQNMGVVLDNTEKPTIARVRFKEPLSVGPRKVMDEPTTGTFVFLLPKSSKTLRFRFPGARETDIKLPDR